MSNLKFRTQAKRFIEYRRSVGDPVKDTPNEDASLRAQISPRGTERKRASYPSTVFNRYGAISGSLLSFVGREGAKT